MGQLGSTGSWLGQGLLVHIWALEEGSPWSVLCPVFHVDAHGCTMGASWAILPVISTALTKDPSFPSGGCDSRTPLRLLERKVLLFRFPRWLAVGAEMRCGGWHSHQTAAPLHRNRKQTEREISRAFKGDQKLACVVLLPGRTGGPTARSNAGRGGHLRGAAGAKEQLSAAARRM